MAKYGILVDFEWCTGCHTCEVACQMENHLPTDRFGVKLAALGPWEISKNNWQHDNIPLFTNECNLCAHRVAKGKEPTCVKHCQSKCLVFGTVDELKEKMTDKSRQMLFIP
ncbi:MAG: oxidoreductase [Coriobacteriia bacterium]|nr:oxidoreductase [Coriobacteriia bacterium]